MRPVPVTKTSARFVPDPTRVITKPFTPGTTKRAPRHIQATSARLRVVGAVAPTG